MIDLPLPGNFFQAIWFALGLTFGRGFGKNLDQGVQESEWFKRRGKFTQGLLRRCLDVTHHWWIGAILMLYAAQICLGWGIDGEEIYWFGYGLFIDDLPDVPSRLKDYFGYVAKYVE